MESEFNLGHCLVCNSDLIIDTDTAYETPVHDKLLVNGFCKKVNGVDCGSPIDLVVTDSKTSQLDSTCTRGGHKRVFCRILNLPSAEAEAVLEGLKMYTKVFCRQCLLAIDAVAELYVQITRLQEQIDTWRSQFESQIKCQQRCPADSVHFRNPSVVERLRGLIMPGSEFQSRGASPQNLSYGLGEFVSDIPDQVTIKLESEDQEDTLGEGETRANDEDNPSSHVRLRKCSVILQRLEDLPPMSLVGKMRRSKFYYPASENDVLHSKSTRRRFKCNKCDAVFKTEHKQKQHMLSFHGVDQFSHVCSKCGKRFCSELKMYQHIQRQGGECRMLPLPEGGSIAIGMGHYKFKCNVCHLAVATKSRLQTHMQVHNKQKPYICDICGKAFSLLFHLSRHQKWKHFDGPETEHPFKCTVKSCEKVFSSKTTLKVHNLREHRHEFNHHCNKCEYKAVTIGKLNEHISRKHSEFKSTKAHPCQQCHAVFQRSDRLKLHVLRTHTRKQDVPFTCELCDKTFFERYRLKQHAISTHTNERPETCQICGKGFALKHYLTVHMRSHRRESDRRKSKTTKSGESPHLQSQKQKQQLSMIIVEVPPLPAAHDVVEIPSEVLELEVENPPDGSPAPAIPASVLHEVSLESMLTMQVESPYRIEFDEEFKMTNPILEN